MAKRYRRLAAVTAAFSGVLGSLFPWGAARADNFGSGPTNVGPPTNEISLGNNKWHSYSFHSASSAWRTALNNAAVDGYNPTDVDTSQIGDSQNTDVRVVASALSTGVYGWVSCPVDATRSGTDPTETCWNQWLKIDTGNAGAFDSAKRKSLMCHEFGHTLGLRHREGSPLGCMTNGSTWPTLPTDHDKIHLNDTY